MKIKIKFFAKMRETAGTSEEIITTSCTNADELLSEVINIYGLQVIRGDLKVAINEEYVDFSTSLSENDTVVFIPPVAGG